MIAQINNLLSQVNELTKLLDNNAVVYIPEDNETYIMEKFELSENENLFTVYFSNIKAILKGNYVSLLLQQNPSLRPIIKYNMKRKVLKSSIGSVYGVTCVPDGAICIILFPKKFIDE